MCSNEINYISSRKWRARFFFCELKNRSDCVVLFCRTKSFFNKLHNCFSMFFLSKCISLLMESPLLQRSLEFFSFRKFGHDAPTSTLRVAESLEVSIKYMCGVSSQLCTPQMVGSNFSIGHTLDISRYSFSLSYVYLAKNLSFFNENQDFFLKTGSYFLRIYLFSN